MSDGNSETTTHTENRLTRLETTVNTLAKAVDSLTTDIVSFKDAVMNRGKPTGQFILMIITVLLSGLAITGGFVHFYVSGQVNPIFRELMVEKERRIDLENRMGKTTDTISEYEKTKLSDMLKQVEANTENRLKLEFQRERVGAVEDSQARIEAGLVSIQTMLNTYTPPKPQAP